MQINNYQAGEVQEVRVGDNELCLAFRKDHRNIGNTRKGSLSVHASIPKAGFSNVWTKH